MKMITDYEIVRHGIDNSQYFQGCGTSFTDFDEVATGIGDNPKEAFEDAAEQLAMMGWNVDNLKNEERDLPSVYTEDQEAEDTYYYLSIRVK